MQLAKIRRKSRPVKKKFHEIWKIAVDLGEFGARRQGRCGAPGRSAARSAVVCGAAEGARRRGGRCRVQARRGHGERDCGTGTACGTGRRGGRCRVQARLGAPGWRDSERNAARGAGAGRKTTHLRRTPATNRPELALSAIRTASRMKAMRFGRLCALPPPNSTNRKPNRHHRRPILCILIRFAGSQNADRTLMRVGSRGDRIAARTTIREGEGDARERYARAEARAGAMHEGDVRGRCTRAMRGPKTTNRQLKDGTQLKDGAQLQSLWSDRRTRPESPKPRGEGLSPIGTIRFGGV